MSESAVTMIPDAPLELLLDDARCNTGIFLSNAIAMLKKEGMAPRDHPGLLGQLVMSQTKGFSESAMYAKMERLAGTFDELCNSIDHIAEKMGD